MESSSSILFSHPSLSSICCSPFRFSSKPPSLIHLPLSSTTFHPISPPHPLPFSLSLSTAPTRRPRFKLRAAVEVITVQDEPTKTQNSDANLARRKLYVVNLPWTFPATSVKDMFAECGSVSQIEMIKDNRGRNKGYAFVTMGTPEAAQAAIDKFNQTEISGRVIGVEYAKALKPQSPPPSDPVRETPYKLYVSNLQWKVRSTHLREFFSHEFAPVSARVVFDSSPGRSAGYGFVSFATKEEADAAIASLNGKELMGRPIILKFSETKSKESGGGAKDEDNSDVPSNEQQNEAPQKQPELS